MRPHIRYETVRDRDMFYSLTQRLCDFFGSSWHKTKGIVSTSMLHENHNPYTNMKAYMNFLQEQWYVKRDMQLYDLAREQMTAAMVLVKSA